MLVTSLTMLSRFIVALAAIAASRFDLDERGPAVMNRPDEASPVGLRAHNDGSRRACTGLAAAEAKR